MKRVAAAVLLTTVLAACAQSDGPLATAELEPAFNKGVARVAICHLNDEGGYHRIQVAPSAVSGHLGHGDGYPGTGQLDEDCGRVPSITLDYSTSFQTALGGGGGGSAFTDVCPAGAVAVGLAGNRGDYYGWAALANHRIDCRELLGDGTLGASSSTPARGWTINSNPYVGTCTGDQVLVGASGGSTWVVSSISGSCASVATILAGGGPESGIGPFAGSGVANYQSYALPCGAGYAVTGTYGGAGDVLDGVGFICTKIVQL